MILCVLFIFKFYLKIFRIDRDMFNWIYWFCDLARVLSKSKMGKVSISNLLQKLIKSNYIKLLNATSKMYTAELLLCHAMIVEHRLCNVQPCHKVQHLTGTRYSCILEGSRYTFYSMILLYSLVIITWYLHDGTRMAHASAKRAHVCLPHGACFC